MGYSEALEKAGAKVIDFRETGDYQGTWGAVVEYKDKKALVIGSYGSCSGCDAFQAEFGWDDEPQEREGKYFRHWNDEITKDEYDSGVAIYNQRLATFGESYLQTLLDKADIENRLKGFNDKDWFDEQEKELFIWALPFFGN